MSLLKQTQIFYRGVLSLKMAQIAERYESEDALAFFAPVLQLQKLINKYSVNKISEDGNYGHQTYNAVKNFFQNTRKYEPMAINPIAPEPHIFNKELNNYLKYQNLIKQLNELTYTTDPKNIGIAIKLLFDFKKPEFNDIASELKAGSIKLDQNLIANLEQYIPKTPGLEYFMKLLPKITELGESMQKFTKNII